jgi:hypothetical protein
MGLLLISFIGLLVPNGIFVYWLFTEYTSLAEVAGNTLAVSFILDAFLAVGLLAYFFAVRPIGAVKWYWFLLLSFMGGLGFGIPFYWWLNRRTGVAWAHP